MSDTSLTLPTSGHTHIFLGEGHEQNERRAWLVIGLCGAMMFVEIIGGAMFGSIALVADGLHMSTHAGALLLAALAYTFARRHANDSRFTFGTGKLGDLAGFTSAIVLAMIALLIGYEAVSRLYAPVPIHFAEALPIAVLGLAVNIGSAWLLAAGGHGHGHSHGAHSHAHAATDIHAVKLGATAALLRIEEDGVPPRFVLDSVDIPLPVDVRLETERSDGSRQAFAMAYRAGRLESIDEVPEPHAFTVHLQSGTGASHHSAQAAFTEHSHTSAGAAHHDNNMRAAVVHVMADAAVSVLVIIGLILARAFGWLWMDSLAGIVGALVIASWSYGLVRDTGAILLDMNPDQALTAKMRQAVEIDGDEVTDLHLWRLGPGHFGAIVGVKSRQSRSAEHYRAKLSRFVSHLTVDVNR
jgi:Co/Zn/Cd efflux system component